jgi:hypothetical protein
MFYLSSTKTTKIEPLGFERPAVEPHLPDAVLVRRETVSDAARIRMLARLDDRKLPQGPFIVAEFSGETVAAMSLASGDVVADPFRRTKDAVDMLRLRAAQLEERSRQAEARERRAALAPVAA